MSDDPVFEIERRFLVADKSIVEGCSWYLIVQAYVFSMDDFAIRIRLRRRPTQVPGVFEDMDATVTVKGPRFGSKREEYETDVSILIARGIIDRSANVIVKKRYQLVTDQPWDIDEFLDLNAGLWIGEIESEDSDEIARLRKPQWASHEVTTDPKYNNENLAVRPYTTWPQNEQS